MDKYCKDCKWCFPVYIGDKAWPECHAPQNVDKEAVLAGSTNCWRYVFCEWQRRCNWFTSRLINTCGKSGRWFEPKDLP